MVDVITLIVVAPLLALIGVIALQRDEKIAYWAVLFGMIIATFSLGLTFFGQFSQTQNPALLTNALALGIYAIMTLMTFTFSLNKEFETFKFGGDIKEIIVLNVVFIGALIGLYLFSGSLGVGNIGLITIGTLVGTVETLIIILIAPIAEELFFRGTINPIILKFMSNERIFDNEVISTLIISVINTVIFLGLFVAVHGWQTNITSIIGLFVLSGVTTFLVNRTRDVRASIPFHIFWNVLALTGLGVVI